MSIRVEECDVTVDFYGDHDRHRLDAERKLLRGGGGDGDGGESPMSTPVTSTPNSTPNPSTSSASNARKRREPDSSRAEAVADKRPRRILNSDEGGAFDGEISFTFAGHSGDAGTPLVLEAGDVAAAAAEEAYASDSDKENVPPPPASPPHPPSVAILEQAEAPPSGGTGHSLPPSSSSSSSVGTIVNGDFPQGGEDSAGVSGLLGLSGAAGGSPRSVESSEPIYYSSSEGDGEEGGETTPTRLQLRAELSASRRREPCTARRQLVFSQDENDRIVPSFWDRED